jgi:hypothetical protein
MSESIGDAPIECGSEFERDKWSGRLPQPVKKDGVQDRGGIAQRADFHIDTGLLQQLEPSRGDRVRIPHGNNDAVHARTHDGLSAWRLLAIMGAGLEGDNQRRPTSPFTCHVQRHCFGMLLPVLGMPSLADWLSVLEHHCADERIILHPSPPSQRQIESAVHGLPLVHPGLEAHSQANAGEELPLSRIKVLEVGGQLLVAAPLVSDFSSDPEKGQV